VTFRLSVVESPRTPQNVAAEVAEDLQQVVLQEIPAGPSVSYAVASFEERKEPDLIFRFEAAAGRSWDVLKTVVLRYMPDLRAAGFGRVGQTVANTFYFLVELAEWRKVRTNVDPSKWIQLELVKGNPLRFREAD
jgi:hypothetical protein